MFCIYCGKEIPDGSECSCRRQTYSGSPSSPYAPVPPASAPTPDNTGAYNNFSYYANPQGPGFSAPYQESAPRISSKHRAVKDAFRSPVMLITCILFSAEFILGLLDGFSMDIVLLLSAVGLWLIYAFSLGKDTPLKPVGFKFHSVILMIERIFLIILYAIMSVFIIILSFIPNELNEFMYDMKYYMSINYNWDFNYDFSFTAVVFAILFVVWTCFFLFVLFYNIKMRNNVRLLSDTVQGTDARRTFSVFPGVVLIMQFLYSAGSIVTYFITAEARNGFLTSFFNTLLKQFEESYDIKFNYTFNFTANYLTVAKMAVSAAALLFAAIMVFRLRAKLNKSENAD